MKIGERTGSSKAKQHKAPAAAGKAAAANESDFHIHQETAKTTF